jgi:YidC/Oxa1 family membrane protein insertase
MESFSSGVDSASFVYWILELDHLRFIDLHMSRIMSHQCSMLQSANLQPASRLLRRSPLPSQRRVYSPHSRVSFVKCAALAEEKAFDSIDGVAHQLQQLHLFVADAATAVSSDAVQAVVDSDVPQKSGGFMSVFADSFEAFLKAIDAGLTNMNVPYSYGFSIIVLTLLVKLATYPLSSKQVESTLRMQQLQPAVKELQAKYANDQERLQMETAKLYQTTGVNPLAGCLPTLATIPIFIGLYRALGNVANEGLLSDGFFWIPSLAGPTKLNGGLGWLVPVDGVPPNGWHDTIAYLVLPVLLTASQFASQKIISPPQSNDPAQQQSQAILKFIPLMIGYFSLNVPSGLTLYWFTNNLVTTAQQVYLRQKFKADPIDVPSSSPGGTYVAPPKPERTGPTGKEMNSRRSNKAQQVIDVDAEVMDMENAEFAVKTDAAPVAEAVGGAPKQGDKFRALKAEEESKKQGGVQASVSGNTASAPAKGKKKGGKKSGGSRKK